MKDEPTEVTIEFYSRAATPYGHTMQAICRTIYRYVKERCSTDRVLDVAVHVPPNDWADDHIDVKRHGVMLMGLKWTPYGILVRK